MVKSESASLIKAKDLQLPAFDDLIGRDGKDLLLFQLLNSVDDADDHADGERWRHCDCDEV